jgi:hypothetical protein
MDISKIVKSGPLPILINKFKNILWNIFYVN